MLVISSFSTQTSYENQTKKAITNKGIQEAMVEMLRHNLEVYFIENPLDAEKIAEPGAGEQAQPGGRGEDPPEPKEQAHRAKWTSPAGWQSSWTAAPKM